MSYYLTSLRKENFEVLEKNGFSTIGFNEKSRMADRLNNGDIIVLYIGSRVSKIAGYIVVDSKCYWDNDMIWDDVFPKRIKTFPSCILKNMIDIREIVDKLSFVRNKQRFGMSFMSGLRSLPELDGKFLIKEIEKRARENYR